MKKFPKLLFLSLALTSLASQAQSPATGGADANQITGKLVSTGRGEIYVFEKRDGSLVTVDASAAEDRLKTSPLLPRKAYTIVGTVDEAGVLRVSAFYRIKSAVARWPADR